jgi:hypothetical protein
MGFALEQPLRVVQGRSLSPYWLRYKKTSAKNFMQTSPFIIATDAAIRSRTPMASVGILSAVAAAQIDAGLIDDAFATVAKISVTSDQRSFLLNSVINAANSQKVEVVLRLLAKLVEVDSDSSVVAGRLAQTFLDNNKPEEAMKIVNSIANPFDSWRSRSEFAIKLLEFDIGGAKGIIETIKDVDYRAWGELAFVQRLARSGELELAIEAANQKFSSSLRRAWALFELGKLCSNSFKFPKTERENTTPQSNYPNTKPTARIGFDLSGSANELRLFEMTASILSVVDIDVQNAESFASAFRIIGKFAYNSGKSKNNEKNTNENGNKIIEIGELFLEMSETVSILISVPVQRLRAKLFLAGTLLELGLIGGAGMYVDRRELTGGEFSAIEQSKIWQWAAEADPKWESDWARSVEAVSIAQRKSEELGLAERMSEVVRRYAMRNNKSEPTGKPAEDLINLPARQFEEYYYSPFAIEDCGC